MECAAIWVAVFGTTSVQCQPGGVISAPTLNCLHNPCRLPIAFPEGVEGAEGSSCVEGRYIARGQRCQVQCSPGYQLSGTSADSNEYFCNSDRMVEASLRCVPSTPHDPSCMAVSNVSIFVANRSTSPIFVAEPCTIPSDANLGLGSGIVTAEYGPGTVVPGCRPGQQLPSNDQCFVQCDEGYVAIGGSISYGCFGGQLINRPTLVCSPGTTSPLCAPLPSVFESTCDCSFLVQQTAPFRHLLALV